MVVTLEGGDRLSNLPLHVVHYIFCFLKTVDVIRASVVSKKWRYLWVNLPYLDFDDQLWSKSEKELSTGEIAEKFKDFVSWVLMFQDGSVDIQKFRLCCFHYHDVNMFYRWIHVLARRNVQELDLTISICFSTPVVLPHYLATCDSLVKLKLRLGHGSCVLKLPTFASFSRLKSLELGRGLVFEDCILLRNFISNCPILENLEFWACKFMFKTLDISSTSLKSLTLHYNHSLRFEDYDLKATCPNLSYFTFIGQSEPDCCFQDLNSFHKVHICLDLACEISKLFKGLCNTKALKLELDESLEGISGPACAISFRNLKTLIMWMNVDEHAVQSVINMLNCSPFLEALTLYFPYGHEAHSEIGCDCDCESECYCEPEIDDSYIPNKAISCLTHRLKIAELYFVKDIEPELAWIRFLLKNGNVLQKMNIFGEKSKPSSKIIQRVMKFPRSSSNVAFTFRQSRVNFHRDL